MVQRTILMGAILTAAASVWLWVYDVRWEWWPDFAARRFDVRSFDGRLVVVHDGDVDPINVYPSKFPAVAAAISTPYLFACSVAGRQQWVAMPLWFPLSVAVCIAGMAARSEISARRRTVIGACRTCGYERAGLSRCPECGEA